MSFLGLTPAKVQKDSKFSSDTAYFPGEPFRDITCSILLHQRLYNTAELLLKNSNCQIQHFMSSYRRDPIGVREPTQLFDIHRIYHFILT